MKRECTDAQEAILQLAGASQEPTDKVLRHVTECDSCGEALKEARQVLLMVQDAGLVLDAPDCRTAVMGRISRAERRKPVWAYICALAVAVALVLGVLVLRESKQPARQVVRHDVSERVAPEKKALAPQSPEKKVNVAVHPKPERAAHTRRAGFRKRRLVRVERKHHEIQTAPKVDRIVRAQKPEEPPAVELTPSKEDNYIGEITIVWKAEPKERPESFSYTIKNEDTGESTTGSGERVGNTISITMQ